MNGNFSVSFINKQKAIHRNEYNKLCGDVDFDSVAPHTSAHTPVPGGVGPMTIAMLMSNCVEGSGF